MIVCGGGSRTVTYRSRARLPTPPRDDGLKDKELPNRNSNSNHEFHNSNREPVLPTPGSAKTSIDLPTKSSHKLLPNGGQNVLDRVRKFIEVRPAESLELDNVSWETFKNLHFDDISGFKYDYHLEHLLIQFRSAMHESAVMAFNNMFFLAINQLAVDTPEIVDTLDASTGREIPYADGKSWHIPDLSIRANTKDVFRIEVAFSQTLADVRRKIVDMLKDKALLGVLLLTIKERPKWLNPKRDPPNEDIVDQIDWLASMDQQRPFGCIKYKGIDWMKDVEVHVALFEKGWEAGCDDPEKFNIPEKDHFAFAALDARLNDIWCSVVQQAIGQNVEVHDLNMNWVALRRSLIKGMPDTAYSRYLKWVSGRA